MRRGPASTRALAVPLLLLLASAAPGLAQQKTAAPAERKAFNAVPGPDAEYLLLSDRYTLRDDGSVVHERRSRLQVNTYLAINRKYGESKVDYDAAIESFEVLTNRTVLPSGTVVQAPANAVVDDQPYAAEGNPLWSGLRRKIIVHTALEPGAVVEESYRITRTGAATPWLEVGEPLALEVPVRERVVELDVPEGRSAKVTASVTRTTVMPTSAQSGERRVWTWRGANAAAVPEEPGSPARAEALPFLWASTCRWDEAAGELAKRLEAAGPAPDGAVAAARQAISKETAWESRLLAALAAITGSLNVSAISAPAAHWQIKPLAEVWRASYATPLELATMEAKVLTASGFSARVALLGQTERSRKTAPGFTGFDRPLLMVAAEDGTSRLYDPADPGAGGPLEAWIAAPLLIPGAPGLVEAPNPGATRRELTVVAEVKPDGALGGSVAMVAAGAATPHAALVRDPARVADEVVGGWVPGGRAKPPQITGLGRVRAALDVEFDGKLPDKNELGLVRFTVAGVPGGMDKELPPLPGAGRLAPIALPGPGSESVDLTLAFPKGWRVVALPVKVRTSNALGLVEVSATQGADGKVNVVRRIELLARIAKAEQAAQVRELLVAWNSPASRELILAPDTGGK